MTNHLDHEIQDILTALSQPEETDNPYAESQSRHTLNIYIEVEEQEEAAGDQPPTIDSTLDEQQAVPSTTEDTNTPRTTKHYPQSSDGTEGYSSTTRQRRRVHPALLLFLILPLLGILAWLATPVLLPLWTPSASVTLVTQSQHLTTTNMLHVVTNGNADLTKNQLAGRTLPAITMSQQKTVPTTGMTHQAAHTAHGMLTLYNAAPYVQTVEARTLLQGADGVQVLTDQTALIPSAVMPTEGQISVSAHATIAGPRGNIRAGYLYGPCCRLNVFVANSAFHGGQDARTYQSVTPQDITSVVMSIKTSVEQSVQVALQTQVQGSETLVTPFACTSQVKPDHNIGEEATQVQVTVSETCTGMTYNTQALTRLVTQKATQDAEQRATRRGLHHDRSTESPYQNNTEHSWDA